jgi:ABC-type uncharacterized transport system ATPase component
MAVFYKIVMKMLIKTVSKITVFLYVTSYSLEDAIRGGSRLIMKDPIPKLATVGSSETSLTEHAQ